MQGNKLTVHGCMNCTIGVHNTDVCGNIKLNLYVDILCTRKNYSFNKENVAVQSCSVLVDR